MDALHALIASQKQKVADEKKSAGGQRWIQRGKIVERMRAEAEQRTIEEERKRRLGETERLKELAEHLEGKKRRADNTTAQSEGQHPTPEHTVHGLEGKEEAQPPLAKSEVVKKLRRLKEPVTLFGETDWQRYTRLCQLELLHHEDELMGGQRNAFLNPQDDDEEEELDEDDAHHKGSGGDIVSSSRRELETATSRTSPAAARGASDGSVGEAEGESGLVLKDDSKADQVDQSGVAESSQRPKAYSKETVVVRWIRRMLHEWEAELKARTEEVKNSAEGRFMTSLHRQTRKDVKPLLKKLKRKELEEDIRDKLFDMVLCCEERKYRSAHDTFLLLSIGNAAWPVGVTMVGIHERVGRSKLYTSQVAHILNDETTRKYIQMFKRLISFCQRRYPADPSQTISLSTIHI